MERNVRNEPVGYRNDPWQDDLGMTEWHWNEPQNNGMTQNETGMTRM